MSSLHPTNRCQSWKSQNNFKEYKCQPVNSSQNALRIVREATENKKNINSTQTKQNIKVFACRLV